MGQREKERKNRLADAPLTTEPAGGLGIYVLKSSFWPMHRMELGPRRDPEGDYEHKAGGRGPG